MIMKIEQKTKKLLVNILIIKLKCDADMMKVIIDRFGKSVKTEVVNDESLLCHW